MDAASVWKWGAGDMAEAPSWCTLWLASLASLAREPSIADDCLLAIIER